MIYIGIIISFIIIILITLALLNNYLPIWFCTYMGWHLAPSVKSFDGINFGGICPRCGKKVLQDSQGNWFTSRVQ